MHHKISYLSLLILGGMSITSQYVYFNPTVSVARGYYFVYKAIKYNTNDLVLVCILDERSINILHQLGLPYMANEGCKLPFLLKRIAAKSGDIVVVGAKGIKINNLLQPNTVAIRRYHNIDLNKLVPNTKYRLAKGDYFLLGNTSNSYDSRYFGVVTESAIYYKALLLWARNTPIW